MFIRAGSVWVVATLPHSAAHVQPQGSRSGQGLGIDRDGVTFYAPDGVDKTLDRMSRL
jgi:hypothetical protein